MHDAWYLFHVHYLLAADAIADKDPQVAATRLNQGGESLVRRVP
jgi:hypothetical protein